MTEWMRRMVAAFADRRRYRKQRRVENAHRRAAEHYDEPPPSVSSGS